MIPQQFFDQLMILGLLWLFFMLSLTTWKVMRMLTVCSHEVRLQAGINTSKIWSQERPWAKRP
jgi:hypothetical protein